MICSFIIKGVCPDKAYNWSIEEILLTGTISKPRGTAGGWEVVWKRSEICVTGGGGVLGNSSWLVGWNSGWKQQELGQKTGENWLLKMLIAGNWWWRWGNRAQGQDDILTSSFWVFSGELRTLSGWYKPPTTLDTCSPWLQVSGGWSEAFNTHWEVLWQTFGHVLFNGTL
jgi:hypothetical protein